MSTSWKWVLTPKELRGATKEKESLPQMLRGLSKLRNLGQGYVNFGEPMPLMTYLNQHVPDWRESIESHRSGASGLVNADGQ